MNQGAYAIEFEDKSTTTEETHTKTCIRLLPVNARGELILVAFDRAVQER